MQDPRKSRSTETLGQILPVSAPRRLAFARPASGNSKTQLQISALSVSQKLFLALLVTTGCTSQQDAATKTAQKSQAPASSQSEGQTGGNQQNASSGSATRQSEEQSEELADPLHGILKRADPRFDQWDTEVLNEIVGERLKEIGKLVELPVESLPKKVESWIADDATIQPLRPTQLKKTYRSGILTVSTQEKPTGSEHQGSGGNGLLAALKALSQPMQPGDVHTKFKIVRVEQQEGPQADTVRTEALYQASSHAAKGIVQQNGVWFATWQIQQGSKAEDPNLVLQSLRGEDFTEVVGSEDSTPLLADCTQAVLGDNPSFEQQILRSTNHWRRTLPSALGIDVFGHQGLAIGDANGDGLEDVYACQPGGVPNRLYVQQPDGTARDWSQQSGLDVLDRSRAALFLDLDNDGDQDLAMVVNTHLVCFENDGTGKFTIASNQHVGIATTLAAADYDNDGDIDLYVCGYSPPVGGESAPVPYHDANNGHRNKLLRNDENWNWQDVTQQAGLNENNTRYTLSASWEDFDNDGDMDLYVANDFGRNCLYRNDAGSFVDVAAAAGVEDISAGMGVTWGDYDNDGLTDIYVSNMFSSAGNRVTYQRKFREEDQTATRKQFQRHARGNSLFRNAGDGTFQDVSVPAAVTMGRWAWGSLLADINNDGWRDILVTNGMATNQDTGDL